MDKISSLFSTLTGGDRISSPPAATVTSIFVYPIKSCRGISVPQAPISSTGFRWDREWMVVNSKGRACTQRVEPMLALVEPELPEEAFDVDWEPSDSSYLVLRAPGMDPLRIRLISMCNVVDGISVWDWSGSAFDEGDEASAWFTKYLGKPSRLVRFNTKSISRSVDSDYAQGYTAMFSDGFPYLVISQGSLNSLNEHLKEPLPINRFRTKIWQLSSASAVVGTQGAYTSTQALSNTSASTHADVRRWHQCLGHPSHNYLLKMFPMFSNVWTSLFVMLVPTVNQESGIPGLEPTEAMMKFRTDKALKREKLTKAKVYFGQNFVCEEGRLASKMKGKVVKVGDTVSVLQTYASYADAPS